MNWADFHFLRPYWLIALPVSWALIIWLLPKLSLNSRWSQVIDAELLPHLIAGASDSKNHSFVLPLSLLAASLATLALAGPSWQQLPQPVFDSPLHRVVVLDVSPDMSAQDLKPSRLKRAQLLAQQLLENQSEGDIALVAFSGEAYPVVPLSSDRGTVSHLLHSLSPDIMPSVGNNMAAGLVQARNLLEQAGAHRSEIVLITASQPDAKALQLAEELSNSGHRIHVLAAGTDQAVPIPGAQGFVKNRSGKILISKLDESALRKLADRGDGRYQRIDQTGSNFSIAASTPLSQQSDEQSTDEFSADVWQDEGYWLLIPLMLMSLLAFRRGAMLAVILVPLGLMPAPADAGWWQREDQLAHKQFRSGDHQAAAEQFENTNWKAAALYESGDYATAAKLWSELEDADAAYNQGNALAKAGDLEAAIDAYEEALKRDPQHTDAQANKALLEKLKQEQQQQNQDQQQDQNGESEDSDGEQQSEQNQAGDSEQNGDQDSQTGQEQNQGSEQQHAGDTPDQAQPEDKAESSTEQQQGQPEQEAQQQQAQSAPAEEQSESGDEPTESMPQAGQADLSEQQQQAVQQWLNRIPDNPGGLLRRKFERMDQRRNESRQ